MRAAFGRHVPRLAICGDCLKEMFRSGRQALPLPLHQLHELRSAIHCPSSPPYDRAKTTMKDWPLDDYADRSTATRTIATFTPGLWPAHPADQDST